MIIGFMRNFRNPSYMSKLTAMLCKSQGIDLIYIRPFDVNIEKNKVKGKMFIDNTWINVETDIPPFIDISPYCFKEKNRKTIKYLRNKAFLSDNGNNRISKEKLQEKLQEDNEFAHLVIPTLKVGNDFTRVEDFLNKYSTIVMKPMSGERGKGIYVLKREEKNTYILGHQKEEKKLSYQGLTSFFEESIKHKRYILQKYITSRTIQADPFDCRVHVEKNGEGKWVSARNFIRIGIGQKVVSNVNQGGGLSDPEPFLKANFGSNWKEINDNLNKLAVTLPYKIEELRGTHIMSLGMDIGINSDGKLYLFEANSAPTTAPLKAEAAMLRVEYYKYILQNKINKDSIKVKDTREIQDELEKENKKLRIDFEELKKVKKMYEKKYLAIENSKAWRATIPVRRIGTLFKRIVKTKKN